MLGKSCSLDVRFARLSGNHHLGYTPLTRLTPLKLVAGYPVTTNLLTSLANRTSKYPGFLFTGLPGMVRKVALPMDQGQIGGGTGYC